MLGFAHFMAQVIVLGFTLLCWYTGSACLPLVVIVTFFSILWYWTSGKGLSM